MALENSKVASRLQQDGVNGWKNSIEGKM